MRQFGLLLCGIAVGVGTTLLGWPFTLIAVGVLGVVTLAVNTPDGWAPK